MSNVLTIEGEVSKKGRDQIDYETKRDADICHILHSPLCGSEKHTYSHSKATTDYICGRSTERTATSELTCVTHNKWVKPPYGTGRRKPLLGRHKHSAKRAHTQSFLTLLMCVRLCYNITTNIWVSNSPARRSLNQNIALLSQENTHTHSPY